MVTIKLENLIDFVADVFAHAESSPEEARRIATYLTTANLTGHDSHGVIRVPVYIRWNKMGAIVPDQTAEVVVDTPSLVVVDGKFGYGQTVTPQAVRIGIEKCKKAGLAALALRNSGHLGRVGDWAEMAAAEGLVSVHFVNAAGSLLVAPYGGVEKRLSTAPYCVGIPRQGQGPIVLDFATSIVAEGKVLVASRGGKKLPKGALIDSDGTLSEDPAVLYGPYQPDGARDHTKGTGAIRAFGEHKGSGLAFICELLGGALTGTGATAPVPVKAPPSSSQMKARPEPLCSPKARIAPVPLVWSRGPSGVCGPYSTAGSSLRLPSESISAPFGNFLPPRLATSTLPSATIEVAKSSTSGSSPGRGMPTH